MPHPAGAAGDALTPLALATLAGSACLALSGPFGIAAAFLAGLGGLWRQRGPDRRDFTPFHLGALALCVALGVGFGVVPAFSVLLGWLAAHRLAVLESRTDARVLLMLVTLMALVGSVGTLSIGLLPALVVYGLATPVALLRSFGVRRSSLEWGTATATLVLAAAFFLLVPRLQGSLISGLGEPAAADRFADSVQLGDEFDDPDAEALVLRATLATRDGAPLRGPAYFRGRVLDTFDGRSWRASGRASRVSSGNWDVRADIVLEPLTGSLVYGPPDLLYARGDRGPILQGTGGTLDHGQAGRRVSYTAYSRQRPLDRIETSVRGYDQLPTLDPRVTALAASLAPGSDDPARIAAAAARYLATGFTYDRRPDAPLGDPLAWFLFDAQRGHCEYFASALAVLLRVRGVPARLATGFYSAEYNETGGYVAVRRGHAHAWVEVPVQGGWAVIDATPVGDLPELSVSPWVEAQEVVHAAWLDLVLDYDLGRQFDALARVGAALVVSTGGDPIRAQSRQSLVGAAVVFGALMLSGTFARGIIWLLSRPPASAPRRDPALRA
ncbi:MAG: DUF3488 domain-containing protein, partial [Deltaproteobacteria bacterium]|nr:DUF3488 domain-containing protein [Deltaproteobacteria bacterium]